MLFVLQSKIQSQLGFQQLREVWTKNFKTSPAEGDVEMTGEGEGSAEPSGDEDAFEKQMRLANESDEAQVRPSPSEGSAKAQIDQFERTLMSLGCGDSSMVPLHLEAA